MAEVSKCNDCGIPIPTATADQYGGFCSICAMRHKQRAAPKVVEPPTPNVTLRDAYAMAIDPLRLDSYRSPATLAVATVFLFAVQIFIYFVNCMQADAQITLLQEANLQQNLTAMQVAAENGSLVMTAMLLLAAKIATAIVFLMWVYRCSSNLYSLNTTNRSHTPGWAVGWYFIPVANLIKPLLIMREIWTGSHATEQNCDLSAKSSVSTTMLVIWWIGYLVMVGVDRVAASQLDNARSVDAAIDAFRLMIFSEVIGIVASALAIIVVRRLSSAQDARHQRLMRLARVSSQSAPAAPPQAFV